VERKIAVVAVIKGYDPFHGQGILILYYPLKRKVKGI